MISAGTSDAIVLISLVICVGTYTLVSRREGGYVCGGRWFLPETLFIAILVRFFSFFEATTIYKEQITTKLPGISPHVFRPMKKAEETC